MGGRLQVVHCKVYNMGHCCLPLLCKLNLEDVCFLNLIYVTSLQWTLADRVLCVPCLTLLVDQQGTA